jgi:sugar phosphate isomerase/epimerase
MGALGICPATLLADPLAATPADVRAATEAAAAAGFTHASFWLQHLGAFGPLESVSDALADLGLEVSVIEAAFSWPAADDATVRAEADALVAAATAVGATQLGACCLDPEIADVDRARAGLGLVGAAAADAGLTVSLEFLPWTGVPDLATAWQLVDPLGPSVGILVDTWHWLRQPGGPNPKLLAAIPPERIGYVQICDAVAEPGPDPFEEAMTNRALPGDGVVDFRSLFDQLVGMGATPTVTTEVFNAALVTEQDVTEVARANWRTGNDVLVAGLAG